MSKTTAIFDTYFLNHLPRIRSGFREIRQVLEKWIRSESELEQSALAVQAIRLMIGKYNQSHRNRSILSEDGLGTVSVIADNINKFESLITLIRTRFQRKIYRDHLNHMLRTALLASFIGKIAKLDPNKLIRLVIAALFHDAGYPVQEAGEIMKIVSESVGDGYSLLQFDNVQSRLAGTMRCIAELADSTGIDSNTLQRFLVGDDVEHSVVGAFEFLACCEGCSDAAIEIASAICLHSQEIEKGVSFNDNPLAVCLLIADELQDWGRPAAHPDGSVSIPMEEISLFTLLRYSNQLYCELEYNEPDFPVLDMIYSKYLNLKRIQLDDSPLQFTFDFPLTRFKPTIPIINYLIPPREEFSELRIKRRTKKPWRLIVNETELSYKDWEIADGLESIDLDMVTSARTILMNFENNPPTALSEWKITQHGQSSNYLVTKMDKGPARIGLFSYDGQFHIQINETRTSVHLGPVEPVFGEMIHLNKPHDGVFIPRVLRVLPVIMNLKSVITTGRQVNVFWFKRGRVIPQSIRRRRPRVMAIPISLEEALFRGYPPEMREFFWSAMDLTDNGS